MRVVVFGYHDIGYVCLRELVRQGHEVAAVITHEDDPAEEVWFRSVPALARELGLPTHTPADPNTPEFVALVRDLRPEMAFSFYYRHMLKAPLLAIPPRGCLNLHGSCLPRYRGRAPVNWVLVNGETETGVTLHYMVAKPDAGDIAAQRRVPISFEDTALTLHAKMTEAAQAMFAEVLPLLAAGAAPRLPMDLSSGSYCGGRKPADGRFAWDWPARRIYNLVRAVTHPYPGAFVSWRGGDLRVWWARPVEVEAAGPVGCQTCKPGTVAALASDGPLVSTGAGRLLLLRVQPPGQPEMSGIHFASACGLTVGDDLTVGAD
jgi:methionyl-tRNA formyltransferase